MSGHIKSPEDIVNFLLLVIKSADGFKANYHEVARDAGINTPMNAQRKLKSVAESAGFVLVNGAIVLADGSTNVLPASKPRQPRAKKNGDTPSKKRKKNEDDGGSEDGSGDGVKDEAGAE